jgi:leader peptidase (prepilin peptidase)/N-methyltransferase
MSLQLLQSLDPAAVIFVGVFLGLCVGSFLNVVIYRVPARIHEDWTNQCHTWLDRDEVKSEEASNSAPGIVKTPSHCPSCKTPIKPWHNIPLVSYLLLRGKCSACGAAISIRYPLVELLTALMTVTVFLKFGLTIEGLCAAGFSWALVALAFIDLDHQILPDNITLPLLWAGLSLSLFTMYVSPETSIIGALTGYLVLWSVYQLFRLATGKEGMGYGDFKLLAAMGAWMGWKMLPLIVLLSAVAGTVVGLSLILLKIQQRDKPIPYGPYLAAAGWIALIWGSEITEEYLRASGML